MELDILPPSTAGTPPAFVDLAAARAWLGTQPQADPPRLLAAIAAQIAALDAAAWPAAQSRPLLDLLQSAARPVLEAADKRLQRKAVPLPAADQLLFDAALDVRLGLALALLRLSADPASAALLLQVATLLRQAQFACFQAAQAVPERLDRLLIATFARAARAQLLPPPRRDKPEDDDADAGPAGELLRAVLLRVQDPYRWSGQQLLVAERIVRRWRGLVAFAALPDADPRAAQVSLARLYPAFLLDGLPVWIDVRPLLRKLRQRLEGLAAGQTPQALKLGEELSPTACRRLLEDMSQALRQLAARPVSGRGECELVFGPEAAYAWFTQRELNRGRGGLPSGAVAHRRMEIFGFDQLSQLPGEKARFVVPSERWNRLDGRLLRPLAAGERRQSPTLVAGLDEAGQPRLGVLQGLQADAKQLQARVLWLDGDLHANHFVIPARPGEAARRLPVFLLQTGEAAMELIAPAGGASTGMRLVFAEEGLAPVVLGEVRERGVDFVRFACAPA